MDCKEAQQKITPYIQRKLSDRELEEFIEHIQNCPTCSEELEVYFTIYYALEKLDQDEQSSFNMEELLKKDLEHARNYLQKQNVLKFYQKFFIVVCATMALVLFTTGMEALIRGGIEQTVLYDMLHEETVQSEPSSLAERPTHAYATEEEVEPETNRKFQVIITIPETEYITEKIIDLTK